MAGNLIGESRWARLVHQGFAGLERAAGFAPAFAMMADLLEEGSSDQYDTDLDGDADLEVEFVHLENARFLAGREWLPTGFGLWRGKVQDVTGWCIGYEQIDLQVNIVESTQPALR